MTSPFPVLILAAGLGTRLRPLTAVRAKPAIPVAGEPLIRRIVAWLTANGVREIVVNLHHLPHTITGVLGDGSDLGASVRYSWEQPLVLGSAGGPRQALSTLGARQFYIVNGDTLTDVDLAALAAEHGRSGALVTLALVPNTEYLRYGGVILAADAQVTGWVSRGPAAAGSFHFIGVQIACADIFASLPAGVPAKSIGDVYDRLLTAQPGSVRGCVVEASFSDIGTVADYWKTSLALAGDPRPAAILWDGVEIGEGAVLDECIVTDGVRVPAGATYRRAILLRTHGGGIAAEPWTRS